MSHRMDLDPPNFGPEIGLNFVTNGVSWLIIRRKMRFRYLVVRGQIHPILQFCELKCFVRWYNNVLHQEIQNPYFYGVRARPGAF